MIESQGGGEGDSYTKKMGELLKRSPERYQDPALLAWLEKFFFRQRIINQHIN